MAAKAGVIYSGNQEELGLEKPKGEVIGFIDIGFLEDPIGDVGPWLFHWLKKIP
ncbi:MAG: hypothetical protein ABSB32_15210 [Thermodesulfobacteriota bacterium]|jgi:hypothetical protein